MPPPMDTVRLAAVPLPHRMVIFAHVPKRFFVDGDHRYFHGRGTFRGRIHGRVGVAAEKTTRRERCFMTEPNMHAAERRSLQVFPAGSNGEFNLPPKLCTVIARGKGCEVEDTSGAASLDFSMGWGSVLVGLARPEVAEVVVRQVAVGANFACVNENSLAFSATRGASRSSSIPSATMGGVHRRAPCDNQLRPTHRRRQRPRPYPRRVAQSAQATPASATAPPLSKRALDSRPRSERLR